MGPRTFVPRRVWATTIALAIAVFVLNNGAAIGSGGSGLEVQAVAPTAATVPPERTVPRATSPASKIVKKKVVRKSVTPKKKVKTSGSTKATATTKPGEPSTSVVKSLRATVSGAGTYVAVRAEPDPKSALVRRIPEGTVVSIRCQVIGVAVTDPGVGRKSAIWNLLTTGGYMTNMYTNLYSHGETKIAVGRTCPTAQTGSGSTGPDNPGNPTTSIPDSDTTGKVPARPVITAVSTN